MSTAIMKQAPTIRQAPPVTDRFTADPVMSTRLNQMASDLYRIECDYIGAKHEPFSSLPAVSQAQYRRRVELLLLSGIGYLHAEASARAVRRTSVRRDLYEELSEDGARLAEGAMGDVQDAYEVALLELHGERGSR